MSELILAEFDKPGIYNEVSLEEFSREDLEEENVDKNIADDLEENVDKNVADNLEENVDKNVADNLEEENVEDDDDLEEENVDDDKNDDSPEDFDKTYIFDLEAGLKLGAIFSDKKSAEKSMRRWCDLNFCPLAKVS